MPLGSHSRQLSYIRPRLRGADLLNSSRSYCPVSTALLHQQAGPGFTSGLGRAAIHRNPVDGTNADLGIWVAARRVCGYVDGLQTNMSLAHTQLKLGPRGQDALRNFSGVPAAAEPLP